MAIILPKQIGIKEGKLLFQKSNKVKDFDQGKEIVSSLKETLEHYGGVGLAAPQIGTSELYWEENLDIRKKDLEQSKIFFPIAL
jgi:peptide deformylase